MKADTTINLSAIPKIPVSLYAHIPFCSVKCRYCDFFSRPLKDNDFAADILSAEIRELKYFIEVIKPEKIGTLYIGGGTPSILPRKILTQFLTSLKALLPSMPEEFTVEANPESIDEEFIQIIAGEGAGRISLGIQTLKDKYLFLIGRKASSEINRRSMNLISRMWKGDVNIDVMYGFPGQTKKEALEDLDAVIDSKPAHVSLYALTAEEHTPLSDSMMKGNFPRIDQNEQENIREVLHRRLELHKYTMYEISNYSLPGKESRHNTAYWNLKPYIGIGPGGVSTLPFETVGSGEKGCVRLSGSEDFLSFRREPFDPDSKSIPGILDSEILSPRDFLFDYIHMGFRMTRGLFRDSFLKIFTASPEKLIPDTLQKYNHRILFDEKFIALNDEGRRFLNSFLIDCMTELDRSGWNGPICWPLGDI